MPDDVTTRGRIPTLGQAYLSRENMAQAAQNALEQRRASGEIMTYELDGWIVREYPGQEIVRLARVGELRAEDHPVVV